MKCDLCKKESAILNYKVSYPMLISKSQEMRGVHPSGDILLRVCEGCETDRVIFHCPETRERFNNAT